MKCGHLERIRMELTVKTPLYIGSGEKKTAKEVIVDPRRRIVLVPSLPDMVEALLNSPQRGLAEKYMNFMIDARQRQLFDFLFNNRIWLSPPPAWISYTIPLQDEAARLNSLLTFVKNPQGMSYIPGSSLKGALRTALIAARMGESDRRELESELRNKPKGRRASVVERTLRTLPFRKDPDGQLKNDPINDVLRAIEVSDSAPFPADALTVCRRHWISSDGEDRSNRSPVFMECLRPGVKTVLYLTIDHSLWSREEDALESLRAAPRDWDALCRRSHDSFFAGKLASPALAGGVPVVLGGGTGFQRKSLVYCTDSDTRKAAQLAHRVLRAQFFRTYKPSATAKTAPYMFKAVGYEGRLWPTGVCELAF